MGISIKVEYSQQPDDRPRQSYDLKVEVIEAEGVSPKIFVYQRKVQSAMDQEANAEIDSFISIADPADLEEIPEDEPNLEEFMPFYRTNSVLLRFRSVIELVETEDLIDRDLKDLVASLKAAKNLLVVDTVEYK